ncbi:MAG: glycosyltransferase family 39 protein, partial [Phycisphaeraceae bacterium]|nr:glycosyltransferase family 39 protein [Phycisphaeraceae bacterium]
MRTIRHWLLPLVFLLCMTLPHLGQGDWQRTDGAWYGAIAVQAWRTGELWTLHGPPGQPYFNKPPLAFWLHGFALHVAWPGALAARLPSVLAACVGLLAGVWTVRMLAGRRAALLSGVTLALTVEYFRRTREISLDLWQAAFVMLALALLVRAILPRRSTPTASIFFSCTSGAALGTALLTKPIVALATIPLLAAWLAWDAGMPADTKRRIDTRHAMVMLALAVGISLVVALPWHLSMFAIHGSEFVSQYLGAEVVDRAAGRLTSSPLWAKPWWFYLHQISVAYWPWLACVAIAMAAWTRRGRLTGRGSVERWAVVWAVGWLLLLSIFPDRRDRYAVIVWPALSVLAGLGLAHAPWAWLRYGVRGFVARWQVIAACVIAGAILFSLLPVRVQRPIEPQWPALFAFLDTLPGEPVWQGAFNPARGARLYLERGAWPTPTRDRWGNTVADPPEGALLIYHRRDGLAPGANERTVFTIDDLTLTRLGKNGWHPVT